MKRVVLMLLLSVLTLLLSVPVSAQWQPPLTPDGQPDMQGFWRTQAGRLEDGIRADTEINRVITGAAGPPPGAAIVEEDGFELWENAWHEGTHDIDRLLRGGIGR